MRRDAEIAAGSPLRPIDEVAATIGIPKECLMRYGEHIAKVKASLLQDLNGRKDGKLILVTAMSPTPAGEGKTTVTIGLSQSLKLLGKKVAACIRQPSIGPFFGAKGGATGGGYSQVLPPEDITLQFTGDDYAITTAHNLISSITDNHIYHGNKLDIDIKRIFWTRVSTVNDRALRRVTVSLGKDRGARVEEFHISAASEVMSALCLSNTLSELKERLGNILVALDKNGNPVKVKDLGITGALAALMKNAINPNLVQSIEGVPVFVHGGPFGNISIGCNSLISTSLALKLSDYVLTEAGFSTELGAEKFFDIKCRVGGLRPNCAVIVATLNALRLHGGSKDYHDKDIQAAKRGLENLLRHIENIRAFGIPFVVALNRFSDDDKDEMTAIIGALNEKGIPAHIANIHEEGGKGGVELAQAVIEAAQKENRFDYLYPLSASLEDKIATIAKKLYGADGVTLTDEAKKDIEEIERLGYSELPVCMAKTPKSLSDDPSLAGVPKDFRITVNRLRVASGAGFVIAYSGNILLMPGLPGHPLAEKIDVDENGKIIF